MVTREDITLVSHVNSEMDKELSKAFVNFLMGTSGLVVCKNKFFKSCSKEVKERNQIIENLFGFSTPLTIEEAVAKTKSNIRILTEFTKKISAKYGSYITNFENKINDMSKFYFDREDLIDSETEGYKQNCDNLEKNLQEYRGLKKRIKEANTLITYGEVMKFIGLENNLSILTKELDKTLKRECRGKINDDMFKKEYSLFLLDTFGLTVLKTNLFSPLNSLKKKRNSIVKNINKYISSKSIPEPVWNMFEKDRKKIEDTSQHFSEEIITRNTDIINHAKLSDRCEDLLRAAKELEDVLDKLKELTEEGHAFTVDDIQFLKNIDNLFVGKFNRVTSLAKNYKERCPPNENLNRPNLI